MNVAYPLRTYVRRFFTERLLVESHATPNTVATYRVALLLLLRFVAEQTGRNPSELGVERINADLVGRFLAYRENKRGNSMSSSNTRLSAIRSFFRYVAESEPKLQLHCREVLGIRNKEYKKQHARYLTKEEIKELMEAPDGSSWLGRRDRMLLLLMLKAGLRISEVIGLRIRDVELGTNAHVRCNANGPKERKTPLPPESQQALQNWVSDRRAGPDDPLFMSTHGKPLSQDAVQRLVRKHAKKASEKCPSLEDRRVTPHVLRHTAAMQLLQEGKDHGLIGRWLGYKSGKGNGVDGDEGVELKEGAKAQTHSIKSGYDQSVQKDELLEFLETL